MPRSAIIWTRSRELSLKARYHLTQNDDLLVKCRRLNRSCAEVGFVIPAVIAPSCLRFGSCNTTVLGDLLQIGASGGAACS